MKIDDITTKDIGNIMFGDFKKEPEPDTEVERYVFNKIYNYIANSETADKKELSRFLKMLNRLKNTYPEDLIPSSGSAYRGIGVSEKIYKMILPSIDQFPKIPKYFKSKVTFEPKNLESWSLNKEIAIGFMRHYNYKYPALIEMKIDDSFIMNEKLTNLISNYIFGAHEYEIFRIPNGPIEVEIGIPPGEAAKFLGLI